MSDMTLTAIAILGAGRDQADHHQSSKGEAMSPYLSKEASRKRVEAFLRKQVQQAQARVQKGEVRVWDQVCHLPRPVAEAISHGVHHGTKSLGFRWHVDRLVDGFRHLIP